MSSLIKTGDYFGGCKILSQCGKGAYGMVYLAENTIGERLIIKVVENTEKSNRELNGIRNYMKVCKVHPSLLQIFHVGKTDDGFYYTMEAADNLETDAVYRPATVSNLMRQGKIFSLEEAIRIIKELLCNLKFIHEAGLIHRDIKPDNIIFVGGKAKLSDPGLVASLESRVSIAGSPGFMPPEILIHNLPVKPESDLYALGKVFYCMITGNSPEEYPHLPKEIPLEIRRQVFPALSRMCNSNPSKRFHTVDEFFKKLPKTVRPANFYERILKNFQDWKTLNRECYRFLVSFIIFLLFSAAITGTGYLWYQKVQEEKLLILKQNVENFFTINSDRRNLLSFQIENTLPEIYSAYKNLSAELQNSFQSALWKKSANCAGKLAELLSAGAEKLLPVIPDKNGDFQQDFALIGRARGFILSPLYAYLPAEKQKVFQKKLTHFESNHYKVWSGPRCDREWNNFQNQFYAMVFLPPGSVRMDHNQKIIRIPYHFWMMKNEVSHAHFTRMTGISPQYSYRSGTPVERVLWNDVLYYSFVLTNLLQKRNTLPPGYIVRPPTEAEWEYAAKNACLYNETIPLETRANYRKNSPGHTIPSGSKHASKIGLNDIYGNVHEIVLNDEPTKMKHSIVIRGGSFMSNEKSCSGRIEVLKYQNIPYDIGFRVVIAPGDMSYFDKHFFLGGSNMLRSHSRVFELLGENFGCFDWKTAEKLCRLMGGRLAEPDSPELLKKIIAGMPLAASSWGCFLGAERTGDKWYWCSSGKEITFGKWGRTGKMNGDFLTLRSKYWKPETSYQSGIFLCEWDEKAFPSRNKQLKCDGRVPCELLRFSVGNRHFMLIDSNMAWYTARRVCELLGGRLACLDTPEIKKTVIKKLDKFSSHRILLGGYKKRKKWFWLSGKQIIADPHKDKDMPIPTLNRNFITLKNGSFYDSQYSDLFLLEWLDNNVSSN